MRFFLLWAFCLYFSSVFAQPQLRFLEPVSGFNSPVDITGAGDGSNRLFIVEQPGRVKVFDQTTATVQVSSYLNITDRVRSGGERGLLGIAFHPDFENNGHFFVNYTTRARNGLANGTTVISRFTAAASADTVNPNTELVLLTIPQPFGNHNAGDLAFGRDDYLYIPTGDGGGGGDPNDTGQNPQQLLGKMLRIDVDNPQAPLNYGIPASNPFVGNGAVLDEIWALGLRNPWRISFDRLTGDLWIGDVGQRQREEVNLEPVDHPGGLNYGWDCREGLLAYNEVDGPSSPLCNAGTTYTDPVFDYARNTSNGGFSITGGFVYRGGAADLNGWYVCADFVSSNFFLYPPGGGPLVVDNTAPISSPSAFGEDDAGELYVVEYDGTFYRVTTLLSMPVELTSWKAEVAGKAVKLSWQTATETGTRDFIIERSGDGVTFEPLITVAAAGNSTERIDYLIWDEAPLSGAAYYRLRQRDQDGTEALYAVRTVFLTSGAAETPVFRPNPVRRDLFVEVPQRLANGPVTLEVFAADGKKVYTHSSLEAAGPRTFSYVLPPLPAGVYRARISYDGDAFVQNLLVK